MQLITPAIVVTAACWVLKCSQVCQYLALWPGSFKNKSDRKCGSFLVNGTALILSCMGKIRQQMTSN